MLISSRGGGDARRVPVAGIQASWEVSNAGSFSAFARLDDLRRAGLGADLKGRWLEWTHPTAGRWGGVITGRPVTEGVAEIAADGWAALLRGRVLASSEQVIAPAGGLARRAVLAAAQEQATFLRLGTIDEGGQEIGVAFSGDVGDDVLPNLAESADVEWRVDADRVFHLARRLGTDRAATVRLIEERHVLGARIEDDLWTTASAQVLTLGSVPDGGGDGGVGTGGTGSGGGSRGGVVTSPRFFPWWGLVGGLAGFGDDAIGAGWLQRLSDPAPAATYHWPGWGGAAGISPPAPAPWAAQPPGVGANNPAVAAPRHLPPPTVPVELTIADRDQIWAAFDIGDTVRLELGSIGFVGRFRCLVRAVDTTTGAMSAAGEGMQDQ